MKNFIPLIFAIVLSAQNTMAAKSIDFLTDEKFYSLSQSASGSNFNNRWIKAVLYNDGKLEYFNTNKIAFHAEFIKLQTKYQNLTLDEINNLALKDQGRQFLFLTLLVDRGNGGAGSKNSVEIVSHDSVPALKVQQVMEKVIGSVESPLSENLAYQPIAEQREYVKLNAAEFEKLKIPLRFPEADLSQQVYSDGTRSGRLVRIKAEDIDNAILNGEISKNDILLTDYAPTKMPPLQGLIVSEISAPQSHAAMMSKLLNTPFAYVKGSFDNPKYMEWVGKYVYLSAVEQSGYGHELSFLPITIETHKEVLARIPQSKYKGTIPKDLKTKELIALIKIQSDQRGATGNKAANLAEILRTLPIFNADLRGFSIPAAYFFEHILNVNNSAVGQPQFSNSWVGQQLNSIAGDNVDYSKVAHVLASVRDNIKKSPIDLALLKRVKEKILKAFPENDFHQKIRIRSSGTIEDDKQLNMAGQAQSKGVKFPYDLVELEKDIKAVWASHYGLGNYLTRKHFSIVEADVAMPLLINNASIGELARGVLVVTPHNFGVGVVNMKLTGYPGDKLKVVDPQPGKIPEISSFDVYGGNVNVSVNQYTSELPAGRKILTHPQYLELYDRANTIYQQWLKDNPNEKKVVLDMEWKLLPASQGQPPRILIKQARQVPKKIQRTQEYPLLISGSEGVTIYRGHNENPDALLRLQTQSKLYLHFDSFEMNPNLDLSSKFKNGHVVWFDGKREDIQFNQSDLKITVGPWREIDPSEKWYTRSLSIELNINTERFPSLQLSFNANEQKKNGELLSPAFLSLADIDMGMSAERKDFVHLAEGGNSNVDRTFWNVKLDNFFPAGSSKKLYGVRTKMHSIGGENISIELEGVSRTAGFDKTYLVSPTEVKITGLSSSPIVISEDIAMVYAAAHHNFSWEFAFDLDQARSEVTGLPLGGRFHSYHPR